MLNNDHKFCFYCSHKTRGSILVRQIILSVSQIEYGDGDHELSILQYRWFLKIMLRKEPVMSGLLANKDQLVCQDWHSYHCLLMLNQRRDPVWKYRESPFDLWTNEFPPQQVLPYGKCDYSKARCPYNERIYLGPGYLEHIPFNKNIINEWMHKWTPDPPSPCFLGLTLNVVFSYKIPHFKGEWQNQWGLSQGVF